MADETFDLGRIVRESGQQASGDGTMDEDMINLAPALHMRPGEPGTVQVGSDANYPGQVYVQIIRGEHRAVTFYLSPDDAEAIAGLLWAAAARSRLDNQAPSPREG